MDWVDVGGKTIDVNSHQVIPDQVADSPRGDGLAGLGDKISDWWNNSALNPGTWQSKIQNYLGIGGVNSANSQGKIAYTKSGVAYDETNPDSMINALNTEYAYKRDDQAYTRLIKQLKDNGINPALVLGNTSAMSSDNGFRSSYSMTTKDQVNSALKAGTLLVLLMKLLQ